MNKISPLDRHLLLLAHFLEEKNIVSAFVRNVRCGWHHDNFFSVLEDHPDAIIGGFFSWTSTPEGASFWANVKEDWLLLLQSEGIIEKAE